MLCASLFYVLWHIFDIYQVERGIYFRKKYIFARSKIKQSPINNKPK